MVHPAAYTIEVKYRGNAACGITNGSSKILEAAAEGTNKVRFYYFHGGIALNIGGELL